MGEIFLVRSVNRFNRTFFQRNTVNSHQWRNAKSENASDTVDNHIEMYAVHSSGSSVNNFRSMQSNKIYFLMRLHLKIVFSSERFIN